MNSKRKRMTKNILTNDGKDEKIENEFVFLAETLSSRINVSYSCVPVHAHSMLLSTFSSTMK